MDMRKLEIENWEELAEQVSELAAIEPWKDGKGFSIRCDNYVHQEMIVFLCSRSPIKCHTVCRFNFPSDILNEFEEESNFLSSIIESHPNQQLTEPWVFIGDYRLVVRCRCENS